MKKKAVGVRNNFQLSTEAIPLMNVREFSNRELTIFPFLQCIYMEPANPIYKRGWEGKSDFLIKLAGVPIVMCFKK